MNTFVFQFQFYSGKENGLILFFSGTCICDLNCTAPYWPGMHLLPFLPYRGRAVYRNIKRKLFAKD